MDPGLRDFTERRSIEIEKNSNLKLRRNPDKNKDGRVQVLLFGSKTSGASIKPNKMAVSCHIFFRGHLSLSVKI